MNDVSVYLGRRRRGESLIKRTSFEAFSCSFCPGTGVLNIHEAKKKRTTPGSKRRVQARNALV